MNRLKRGIIALVSSAALVLAPTGTPAIAATNVETFGHCTIPIKWKPDYHVRVKAGWKLTKVNNKTIGQPDYLTLWTNKVGSNTGTMSAYSGSLQLRLKDKNGHEYYYTVKTVGSQTDDIIYEWIGWPNESKHKATTYPSWRVTVWTSKGKCTARTRDISW